MAAPATPNNRWKNISVPLSTGRVLTVTNPTNTNPTWVIGDGLLADGTADNIALNINDLKAAVTWMPSHPNTVGVYYQFVVPNDLALFKSPVDGLYDSALRIECRMTNNGTSAAAYHFRCQVQCEGYDDSPVSNLADLEPTQYTYPQGVSGDQANAVFDFTNLRDSNNRCIKPGDSMGVALWWREAGQVAITRQIYFLNVRYRAKGKPSFYPFE